MNNFNKMISIADACLLTVESEPYTQAIVLLAQSGRIYKSVILNAISEDVTAEKQIIQELKNHNDVLITKLVCKWAHGGVDLPSYSFRELLCKCNKDNKNTLMLLNGGNKYIQKTIGQTMQ